MKVSFKSKKDQKYDNILCYVLYGNLNQKEFPIANEAKTLMNKLTNQKPEKINELSKRLNLEKMETSLEILYALKKEFRGGNYV